MATLKLFFFLSCLSILGFAQAQDRAPHGLAYEKPVELSPLAYDFFHPNSPSPTVDTPCYESDCAPMPLSTFSSASSAVAVSTLAHESKFATTAHTSESRIGAGGIAGIVFGFAAVIVVAMGVYYVVATRRNNAVRANSVQCDV